MLYKVELKTKQTSELPNRYPTLSETKDALEEYIHTGQGIVSLHRSFYDYHWDTELSDYLKVDSIETVGHITQVFIENEQKIFLLIDFNETFEPKDEYICFYRATMQPNPKEQDRRFHISNLFAVDLVTILESEKTENMELSSIKLVEGLTEEWWKI